jgi:uncharacterized membrane protein
MPHPFGTHVENSPRRFFITDRKKGAIKVNVMFNAVAIILHLIAINVWIGGMFFLVMVLGRAISTLEQVQQLTVWAAVLKYFFFWVWLAVLILLSTGIAMLVYRFHEFMNAPTYVLVMACLGVLMMLIFSLMYFVFYQKFKHAIQEQAVEIARANLRVIRTLGFVNMTLGLCVVIAIGGGPYIPFLN